MKKAYVKPSMESEEFIPSAYCVACSGVATYDAWCNHSGYIFHDYDGDGYLDPEDTYIYPNEACNAHYRSEEKPKFNALAFNENQVDREIEDWFLGIPIYGDPIVKSNQKARGTRGFVYNQEHFSTKFSTDPHYVS